MKSYTNLEQSQELRDILPIHTADMYYNMSNYLNHPHIFQKDWEWEPQDTPCWSLAALLEVLNSKIYSDDGDEYTLYIYKESDQYSLSYIHEYNSSQDIELGMYDEFVDCCYDMIIKLHELNLI